MSLRFAAAFLCEITRGDFPQNSCRFFISFLSRGRKRTKQEKEDAARAKFACIPGAPPLGLTCLRRRRREIFNML